MEIARRTFLKSAGALGLPRTLALRVLGNGVVPQQAAVALRLLLCPHRWAVNP